MDYNVTYAALFTKKIKYIKRIALKNLVAWCLILPSLVCFLVFVWQPFISGAIMSMFKTKGFEMQQFVGFQNFKNVMSDSSFLNSIWNSCKYTLWSLLIGLPLPIILAIILNEIVHAKGFFRIAVYFPSMIPGIVAAIMWKIFFDPGDGGLLNMILMSFGLDKLEWLQDSRLTIFLIVIVTTWSGFGPTTILYLADLQSVNTDLYEAASIDGVGIFGKIWNITLPHMSGLIKMMAIMQIIGVFQSFEKPLAMTGGGPNEASITVMMLAYDYMFKDGAIDKATALCILVTIILIIFSIIYFRVTNDKDNVKLKKEARNA